MRRFLLTPLLFLMVLMPPARAEDALATVLQASGWTDERLGALASGEPLTANDTRDLLQLADRLGRFADQLRQDAAPAQEPSRALRPVVKPVTVMVVEPLRTGGDAGELPGQRVTATSGEQSLTLLANTVPAAWREPGVLPQPAEVVGLTIKPGVVLVVDWRWLPVEANYPHVNFGESVLGSLGVDVGLLERLADGGRLRSAESEPFYAVLSATRQIGAHQLARFARGNLPEYAEQWRVEEADAPRAKALAREAIEATGEGRYPIAPLFNDAVRQRGELYVLDGVARRAVAIETAAAAGERSVSAGFGVGRYYEIELFTPDSRNLPIVFCALEAPEGFPLGDRIEAPVRVAGFLFKRWAYRTRQQTDAGADKPQLAPLLIGRAPVMLAPPASEGRGWGVAVGLAFAAALGLVWWVVWRTNRSDAQFEREVRRRAAAAADTDRLARLAEIDGLSTDAPAGQNQKGSGERRAES